MGCQNNRAARQSFNFFLTTETRPENVLSCATELSPMIENIRLLLVPIIASPLTNVPEAADADDDAEASTGGDEGDDDSDTAAVAPVSPLLLSW